MMWGGLVMEFEIVGGATDAIISPADPSNFPAATTSTSWQIEDVRIVGDVVSLGSALQNSYAEHVLSGKSLPINYSTYISLLQTCTGPNIAVNVTRAVSRLKTVFFSFDVATPTRTTSALLVQKEFNSVVHPLAGIYVF